MNNGGRLDGVTTLRDWLSLGAATVPLRVSVAFDFGGLVGLATMYRATKSVHAQTVVLIVYPLFVGALMLWHYRPRGSTSRVVGRGPLSTSAKAVSVAFLLVWGIIVVMIVNPVLNGIVGPWFAWWLVIVSSIEFDRALRRRESGRVVEASQKGF